MEEFHLADRDCVAQAISAAAACNSLDELYEAIRRYDGHDVAKREEYTHSWPVSVPVDHPDGPLLILNEKPENPWDREADQPFTGKDYGWAMAEVLGWCDVDVRQCHTTFACHWVPDPEKAPNSTQMSASRPFLFREIELVKPRAILIKGRACLESMFRFREPITPYLGMSMMWKRGGLEIPCYISWHEAYPARFQMQMGDFGTQIRGFFDQYGKPDGSAVQYRLKKAA